MGVLYKPEYADLFDGDFVPALLLSQFIYWYKQDKNGKSKLRVKKRNAAGGTDYWLAKSWIDLQSECKLSRHQSHRGLQVMNAKGLIETKVFRFAGTPTLHIRFPWVPKDGVLIKEPSVEMLRKVITIAATGAVYCPSEGNPLPLQGQPLTESTTESTTEITYSDLLLSSQTTIETVKKQSEQEQSWVDESENIMVKLGKTVEEIQSNISGYKAQQVLALDSQWVVQWTDTYPNEHFKPLTTKDRAVLKKFAKDVENEQLVRRVITYVIGNWSKFTSEASAAAGQDNYPTLPNIGYLQVHQSKAVSMTLKYDGLSVQPIAKPTQLVHNVPTVATPQIVEKPLSKEEEQKMIDFLLGKSDSLVE